MAELEKVNKTRKHVQSLERSLDILEAMGQEGKPITITELAEKVNLKASTVHRLLSTLGSRGFVEQNQDDSRYRLGLKLLQIGNTAIPSDIRLAARPYMEELMAKCQETVNLSILDGTDVVFIDQVESRKRVIVKMFARVGARVPAYCAASGKLLLAFTEQEKQEKIVSQIKFEKHTPDTIDHKDDLVKELERIQKEGYALDWGELEEHIRCVAVPVFNYEKTAVASLSVSGLSVRMNISYMQNRLLPLIKEISRKISYELGFQH